MDEVAKRIANVASRWESERKRIAQQGHTSPYSGLDNVLLDLCRLALGQAAKIEGMESRLQEVERLLGAK